MDARWTKKNAEVHYGYKNHVKADAQSKLIEQYASNSHYGAGRGRRVRAPGLPPLPLK